MPARHVIVHTYRQSRTRARCMRRCRGISALGLGRWAVAMVLGIAGGRQATIVT